VEVPVRWEDLDRNIVTMGENLSQSVRALAPSGHDFRDLEVRHLYPEQTEGALQQSDILKSSGPGNDELHD
jgi:hypothetical protein